MKYIEQITQNVIGEYDHNLRNVSGTVRNHYNNPARKGEAEAAMSKFGQFLDEFTEEMLKPHIKVCKVLKQNNNEYVLPMLNMVNYYKRKGIREALKKFHPKIFEKRQMPSFGKVDPSGANYGGFPIGRDSELAVAIDALNNGTNEQAVMNHLAKYGWDAQAVFDGLYDGYITDHIGEKYVTMIYNYLNKKIKKSRATSGPQPVEGKFFVPQPDEDYYEAPPQPEPKTVKVQTSSHGFTVNAANSLAEALMNGMSRDKKADAPQPEKQAPNPFRWASRR